MKPGFATALAILCAALLATPDAHAQSKSIEMKLDSDVWDPGKKKARDVDDDELQIPEEAMDPSVRDSPAPARKGKGPSDDEIDIVTPEAGDHAPPPAKEKEPPKADKGKAAPDAGTDAGAAPAVEAKEAKEEKKPEPIKAELLVVPTEGAADIYAHWEKRRMALTTRDFNTAEAELKTILKIRLDTGMRNLFRISSALVTESRHAMKARDWGLATSLAKASIEAAPDCAAAHLHYGWVAFNQNHSDLYPALRHAGDAAKAAMFDPPTRVMLLANAVFVLGGGLVLALVLFVVVMLLRYARLIVHDLAHLFPRGAPSFFTGAIMTCFLCLPVALGAGPIPVLFFWIVAVWTYASARERTFLGAALLVLAALPFSYQHLAVLLDQGESDATAIYRVFRDGDARTDVDALIAEAKGGSRDNLKLNAAGLWLKRAGKYAEAELMFKSAESVSPRDPVALVNLGNVYLVQDKFDAAVNAYNAALSGDPQNALAHFNLSKLFFRKGDLDKGHREQAEAQRFDPLLVESLTGTASSSINRFVADAEPDSALVLERFLEKGSPRRVLIAGLLERRTLGDFSRGDVPYMLGMAIAALVLLNLVARRVRPSSTCTKCGRPVCGRCNPENTAPDVCGQCFHVYVRKDVPDPKMRNAKEYEVRRHAATAVTVVRAASIVIPGSGQVLHGAPGWGLSIMACTGTIFLFVAMRGGPMPAGTSDLNAFRAALEYAAGAGALAIYGLAIRATFRHTA